MPGRKYTNTKEAELQMIAMCESGMTQQEAADEPGLEKEQIKSRVYTKRSSKKRRFRVMPFS